MSDHEESERSRDSLPTAGSVGHQETTSTDTAHPIHRDAATSEKQETMHTVDRLPSTYAREPSSSGFLSGRRRTRTISDSIRTTTSHNSNASTINELVTQLQWLLQRQQFRLDERAFLRDLEKILAQMKQTGSSLAATTAASATVLESDAMMTTPPSVAHGITSCGPAQSSGMTQITPVDSHRPPVEVKIETLLEAMGALFLHRYQEVRTLAFNVVNMCLTHYNGQLTGSLRTRIFQQVEDHDPGGDFELRQKALRLLTADGRRVEPFHVELGWLLLQWLEESDEQRDLLNLIQNILRRSPLSLDFETVIAITSIVCGRCDVAWSRGDVETCRRFLSFFHVLATHRLEHALGTSVCLRTLCWMVNADGQGTWSVMKLLLNSSAGFQVLRGLITLLDNPWQHNQWVLRGAVFFVGMSCWGSQRVAKLDEIKWAPILLALETCLQSENGVVIFEIILAIQRLVKKYGDSKAAALQSTSSESGKGSRPKKLVVEWDIILRMLRTLRPWLSMANDAVDSGRQTSSTINATALLVPPSSSLSSSSQKPTSSNVPVHLTRIPKELLDTLQVVVDLVRDGKFAGEIDEFYDVLQAYFVYLPDPAVRLLLRHRAEAAHPAHHIDWLHTLGDTMESFFMNRSVAVSVREDALELLQVNLWSSRNVCEDRVIEEVLLPMLADVYDDPEATIRRKALDLVTEVARTLESVRFESLLDILENAVLLSSYEDSQQYAIAGIVSLFSSYFNHLPQSRALRMYDIITSVAETHRQWQVRRCALQCLLHVCEAGSDFRLQWRDAQVRTSRFLYCSRRAVRNQQTSAFVPVVNGLRTLLTLISTESHTVLFRMAVEGLRRMLNNRVILTDIDISDAAMKIISCVDYQAFGRAAIPDKITTFVAEMKADGVLAAEQSTGNQAAAISGMLSRAPTSVRSNPAAVKTSFQDAAVLLCKIRFTTMGLQILELFVSYISELSASARHHLMICIVGALDNQLVIAEEDLVAKQDENDTDSNSGSVHGESAWIWSSRPRTTSWSRTAAPEESGAQASAQATGTTSYAESKPVFPHVPFTSRVLSKLQASTHPSNLLNALTATSSHSGEKKSPNNASTAAASRHARELLCKCLRHVFDAELELLHTATNAVSLLAHLLPDVVKARMDMLLNSAKRCFFTPESAFRSDGYAAVLEMVGNLVVGTPNIVLRFDHKSQIILDLVLVSFNRHVDKATSYLAYRVLCEVIFRCERRDDRVSLAAAALPVLQACSISDVISCHSAQLAEAAIDFLMSFALCNSDLIATPALQVSTPVELSQGDDNDQQLTSCRSWVYHNTIVSIQQRANAPALLVVRRANSTTRWHLAMRQDYVIDEKALQPVADVKPQEGAKATVTTSEHTQARSKSQAPPAVAVTVKQQVADSEPATQVALPRPPKHARAKGLKPVTPELYLWRTRASKAAAGAASASTSTGTASETSHVAFSANAPHNLPVPPLPAYDGVGGSPSFFCEATPVDGADVTSKMEDMLLDDTSTAEKNDDDATIEATEETRDVVDETVAHQEDVPLCDSREMERQEPAVAESTKDPHDDDECDDDHNVKKSCASDDGHLVTPVIDPLFLMMQLFDLSVDDRPQQLTNGAALGLGLNVLDRTPEFETHKIGVLYLRNAKHKSEVEILGNFGGSLRYLKFLRALGTVTRLEGLHGYSGGMDTSSTHSDGKFMLLYRSHSLQMVFHVATMMNSHEELEEDHGVRRETKTTEPCVASSSSSCSSSASQRSQSMKKKRHIGNDFVHIVFKECDDEYDVQTFSGQLNAVHIIVQPLNDTEYRTQVKCKPGIAPFGPLYGTQILPSAIVAQCVRQTCLNANLACQAFHQDLIGLTMNSTERLKQIKQLAARHATTADEWTRTGSSG